MTTVNAIRGPAVTIPSGSNVSNVILKREVYFAADAFTLFGPAALDALDFTIEISYNPEAAVPVWVTLSDGTTDVEAPAAAKAGIYPAPIYEAFRIKASGNVAVNRTWQMQIAESYNGAGV